MKKKIAVFANAWSDTIVQQVLEGLRSEAGKTNTDIYLFLTYVSAWAQTVDNVSQLNLFRHPDPNDFEGIVIFTNTFNTEAEMEAIRQIVRCAKVPVISLEVHLEGAIFIGSENHRGMYELTRHLIMEHNVRDVVYVAGIEGNEEDAVRRRAVEMALAENGLEIRDIIPTDFGYYKAEERVRHWIEEGKDIPDAFICANDFEAIGVCTALQNHGLEVPWDVIVTGFDRIKEGTMTFPMLSSVSRNWFEMGQEACRVILERDGQTCGDFEKIFESKFVPSESCGCVPAAEDEKYRSERIRNAYVNTTDEILMDGFFQNLKVVLDRATVKEDLYNLAGDILQGNTAFLGPDLAICTEPGFFEISESDYPEEIHHYSRVMDVLFQKKAKHKLAPSTFESAMLIPALEENPDTSDIYMFVPLQFQRYTIGYAVCKNDLKMLYERRLYRWINNMSGVLVMLRRAIEMRKLRRQLEEKDTK